MEGASEPRRVGRLLAAVVLLLEAALMVPLFLHRSPEPWILGRYSLPYAVLLAVVAGACAFAGVLVLRSRWRGLLRMLAIVVVLGLSLGLVEGVGQVWAWLHPGYWVVYLAPDPVLGWKQAPGLRWTWTGTHWYAREFSVPIETNSLGFRDRERPLEKPPGCARIALLGDSMVEALQVPFEFTAGALLENSLNERAREARSNHRFEVLNFGISNYSVGQYLLVWEEVARLFAPDVIFCFVAPLQMNRLQERYVAGYFGTTNKPLWIRPTFRLEGSALVREAAADYDAFVNAQAKTLRKRAFAGGRSTRIPPGWFLAPFASAAHGAMMQIQRRAGATETYRTVQEDVFALNLLILEELQRATARAGTRLAVVDASRYLGSREDCAQRLRGFCADHGLGYVPLSDDLLEANAAGVATQWRHDGHFNRAGNEIFAESLGRWLEASGTLEGLLPSGGPTQSVK